MKSISKNILRKTAGFVLIIFGVVAWLFPIIPGWIFIFIGLELIGINLIFFDKIKEYARNKIKNKRGRSDKDCN